MHDIPIRTYYTPDRNPLTTSLLSLSLLPRDIVPLSSAEPTSRLSTRLSIRLFYSERVVIVIEVMRRRWSCARNVCGTWRLSSGFLLPGCPSLRRVSFTRILREFESRYRGVLGKLHVVVRNFVQLQLGQTLIRCDVRKGLVNR